MNFYMMFDIVGSHLCPNTIYAITKCKDAGTAFRFRDLSASLTDLKYFLALHENDGIYASYRNMSGKEDYGENGKIGLPCFVFEDGFKTLDLNEALKRANE